MKKLFMNGFLPRGRKCKKILLIMRLSLILTFATLLNATASVYSQSVKVNLDLKNASLETVFKSIQDQTEFDFFYKNEHLPQNKVITKVYEDTRVDRILDEVLEGTGLVYRVLNTDIVVTKGTARSSASGVNNVVFQQQTKTITGTVTDENGQPLPGVTVVVTGTTTGTVTNANGEFNLEIPVNSDILTFSFVGMKTMEIELGNRTTINVSMEEETIGIEEVVAIGYGTMKKSDLTGTVSSVTTEKTMDIPNTNVLQAIQGSVPGLSVTTPDRPGESPSVRIRGINSLSAGNAPLIVVDGIIYNGSLNDFNVNDIEKIDVLKDASAAAVFGSRSSNGVIIITTKMGKTEKPLFNFNSFAGVSNPVSLIPVLDGPGYIQKILDFRESIGQETDP